MSTKNKNENQGHQIAKELQELADHVMVATDLNKTALWAQLEELSRKAKLFADIFEETTRFCV